VDSDRSGAISTCCVLESHVGSIWLPEDNTIPEFFFVNLGIAVRACPHITFLSIVGHFMEIIMEIMLPERIVMIDGEFNGLLPKVDDLLQVSMMKAIFDKERFQYLVHPDVLNIFIHSDAKPTKKFHKEHLAECFEKANKSKITLEEAAAMIDKFIGEWKGKAWPCGDCVTTDLGFLFEKGLITHNYYDENDVEVKGTFDFRILEMKPLKVLAETFGWKKPKDILREHDARNDNFNQMGELNNCLAFFKEKMSKG
jgi:oligoribonuclease (3'-5' exoribonuclease)